MYSDRKSFYKKIETERNSKVIAYVTGDRGNMGTQIASDVPDVLLEHLDALGDAKKISLILYTRGGDTLAAWNIINLIREFCDELEIIVPNKCRSAGTLMALGANTIIMTKQATLGPIDPSITREMSPVIPNSNPPQKLALSVESVKGYFHLLKRELGVRGNKSLSDSYIKLSDYIHPVVLGDVYRTQKQIQMLATRLLEMSYHSRRNINRIVSFLCSDSGSHDYTINRTEARKLGLHIESPTQEVYDELKAWYTDICAELLLKEPYSPIKELGNKESNPYSFKRCLIESLAYEQDAFISEGRLTKSSNQVNNAQATIINDDRSFEGWRHINVSKEI
jgi:hypothetical protein